MESPEVPTEHLHEQIHEHARGGPHERLGGWIMGVALSSAILAALAAVASLLAGHHANEAMIEQISAANQWAFFQSKSVKANLLTSKMELLEALGKPSGPKDQDKLAEYRREQDEIGQVARDKEHASRHHLHTHVIFARGVTMFQVSIAVAAISILTNRRKFFFLCWVFGAVGVIFLAQGLVSEWRHDRSEAKAPAAGPVPSGSKPGH